jgi:hypothetical protein
MLLVYLASPYSHPDPAVREQRFRDVCATAATLMRAGYGILSPIAHTHPIAIAGDLPKGWDFWSAYDEALITACTEVWVLMLDGWEESTGVQAEIAIAGRQGKRVRYLDPEDTTKDLLDLWPDAGNTLKWLRKESAEVCTQIEHLLPVVEAACAWLDDVYAFPRSKRGASMAARGRLIEAIRAYRSTT